MCLVLNVFPINQAISVGNTKSTCSTISENTDAQQQTAPSINATSVASKAPPSATPTATPATTAHHSSSSSSVSLSFDAAAAHAGIPSALLPAVVPSLNQNYFRGGASGAPTSASTFATTATSTCASGTLQVQLCSSARFAHTGRYTLRNNLCDSRSSQAFAAES